MATSSSVYGSENGNIADLLCRLVTEQAAPQVTIEPFDGNPLNFAYFLSMFTESLEKKIENSMGRLTRLIKCTTGEAQELLKHFISDKPEQGYRNAIELLRKQYGNPHRLLAVYRMKINTCHQSNLGAYQHLESCLIS